MMRPLIDDEESVYTVMIVSLSLGCIALLAATLILLLRV